MSSGYFSLSFRSLRAQLDTLLDGVGGVETMTLLDELSKLEDPERKALLNAFLSVARELTEVGDASPESASDSDETNLAIKICDEILKELQPEVMRKSHLQVVPGGRHSVQQSNVIRLDRHTGTPPTPPFKPVA
jgi:hypothetical protein